MRVDAMNVLLLTTNYHPVIGGAETYARELGRQLVRRSHEVTIFTDGGAGSLPHVAIEDGVRVIRDTTYFSSMTSPDKSTWEEMYFSLLPAIFASVDMSAIDVVHANGHAMAVLASMLKFSTGTPVVVTAHEFEREHTAFGDGRCRLVYQALPIDAYIAVSEYYLAKAVEFGVSEERVHRVNLGVDSERFTHRHDTQARSRFGLPATSFVVSCVGRVKQRKGQLELLAAVAMLRETLPSVKLVLAGNTSSGSSDYQDQVDRYILDHDLGDWVLTIPDLSHEMVPCLYAATDVAVQPSYAEGLGLATVEAMSCGVPVVTTWVSGLREVVQPEVNGIAVPPKDTRSLADAILRLARSRRLRETLTQSALRTVLENYTLESMAHQTEKVYESTRTKSP